MYVSTPSEAILATTGKGALLECTTLAPALVEAIKQDLATEHAALALADQLAKVGLHVLELIETGAPHGNGPAADQLTHVLGGEFSELCDECFVAAAKEAQGILDEIDATV